MFEELLCALFSIFLSALCAMVKVYVIIDVSAEWVFDEMPE
jgi:hypothetical protein